MLDLAIVAGVLAVVAAVRHVIEDLPVTAPMLYVAAGVVLGPDVLSVLEIDLESETVAILAELTLALLLFADASRIDVRRLRRSIGLPARLLGIGLPLTIALGTVLTALLLTKLSWAEAALIAAVLAPTDAALGEAVVSNEAVPVRVRQALNVESGLNDGMVVPAVTIFLSMAIGTDLDGPGSLAVEALTEIGIGVLAGVAIAFALTRVAMWAMDRHWTDSEGLRLLMLGGALAAFAGSAAAGGNGFIAAFVCGLLVRAFMGESVDTQTELAEDAAQIGATATFVLFGAVLVWPAFDALTPLVAICTIATLTVGRMVPVTISLVGSGLEPRTVAFIGWFGPRGLASMVFGLLVIQEEALVDREQLFSVIVLVIVASVVLHGVSSGPLAVRYGHWFDLHGHRDMEEALEVEASMLRGERRP
ncbi:MAG: cation:proton antiporter [Ilumatobacteraceae bacterium]|nr:cation:proton antiporter [Ilumatobacteraceae bacterium]